MNQDDYQGQGDYSMFRVTLDTVAQRSKPGGVDMARITSRMQENGSAETSAVAFCEHVRRGGTWCGGCYAPARGRWGAFESMQLIGLDFDNKSAEGVQLKEEDEGYLDPVDALDRCEQLGIWPLCLYFTLSATCPDVTRYRLVFDVGEAITDEARARGLISDLLYLFPEADQKCRNVNRIYLGSNGEIWETYKVMQDDVS